MISTLEDKENPPPMERYTLHFASKIWFPPSKFTVLSNMRFTWGCMYIYIYLCGWKGVIFDHCHGFCACTYVAWCKDGNWSQADCCEVGGTVQSPGYFHDRNQDGGVGQETGRPQAAQVSFLYTYMTNLFAYIYIVSPPTFLEEFVGSCMGCKLENPSHTSVWLRPDCSNV